MITVAPSLKAGDAAKSYRAVVVAAASPAKAAFSIDKEPRKRAASL